MWGRLPSDIRVFEKRKEIFPVLLVKKLQHGVPAHIRSDNGPEFVAKALREWLHRLNVEALFIEPGSPWENGYIESFNGKLRRRDDWIDPSPPFPALRSRFPIR